jgi:hypothetical protein
MRQFPLVSICLDAGSAQRDQPVRDSTHCAHPRRDAPDRGKHTLHKDATRKEKHYVTIFITYAEVAVT